ncbi:YycH family regulatory protein [Ferviditalea candida]|uniref:Two-component system activity regulator YycH n=1 Tax=Ferviditalea candida TaxID=3108399 RepID=A0ABU5ZLR7_9BACL|nr:two-component system activity regulator YycH [Paenibacillaceae bacterium T2]
MKENIKSVLLFALILFSLVQSYLLAYSTPHFESINQTEYIATQRIGTQEKAENLIYPAQLLLHFGDDTHTVFYPDATFYGLIYNILRERAFDGLRATNMHSVDWDLPRKNYKGIELRYLKGISLNMLHSIFSIKGDTLYDSQKINRIWIFIDGNQVVQTYFFDENQSTVYEISNTNITEKDVETFVGFGEYWKNSGNRYYTLDGSCYLPEKELDINQLRYSYTTISAEQMENSLFADPGITRNIQEKDGTQIYTDGKRGLQVQQNRLWMLYSDSIAPVDGRFNESEELYTAVQFINQHGGWNGKYQFHSIRSSNREEGREFMFRQLVRSFPESYPIISSGEDNFGYIRIVLQNGAVSEYERSLIILDQKNDIKSSGSLPGGKQLEKMIADYDKRYKIIAVIPAYRPVIAKDYVDLIPAWAVERDDGTFDFLK